MKIDFLDYTFDYKNHFESLEKLSSEARDLFALLYSFRQDSNNYENVPVMSAIDWHMEHLAKDQLESLLIELVQNGILRKR